MKGGIKFGENTVAYISEINNRLNKRLQESNEKSNEEFNLTPRNQMNFNNEKLKNNVKSARGILKNSSNIKSRSFLNKLRGSRRSRSKITINKTAELSHGKTPQKEIQQQIKREFNGMNPRNKPLPILPATIPARVPNIQSRKNQLKAYKKAKKIQNNAQKNGGKTRKNKRRTRRVTKKRGRKSKKN